MFPVQSLQGDTMKTGKYNDQDLMAQNIWQKVNKSNPGVREGLREKITFKVLSKEKVGISKILGEGVGEWDRCKAMLKATMMFVLSQALSLCYHSVPSFLK